MASGEQRVFILGAGASRSYTESPTGVLPPLAGDFFSTYNELDIAGDLRVKVSFILDYFLETRGARSTSFGEWDEDVESVLTEIEETVESAAAAQAGGGRATGRLYAAVKAYDQMIFLLAATLNEIQNGPVSVSYRLFSSRLGPNDTVLSFNWDTLLDRALATTGHWAADDGYAIGADGIYEDGWRRASTEQQSFPRLVKLHGSTNWLTAYHTWNLRTGAVVAPNPEALSMVFVFTHATAPYPTYHDEYWGGYQPFSYCYYPPNLPLGEYGFNPDPVDSLATRAMPLIIAPVRHKRYDRYGDLFDRLWGRAGATLRACAELYVIGYSFPPTDVASRALLGRALSGRDTPPKVVVINPYPDSVVDALVEAGLERNRISIVRDGFTGDFSD